MIGDAGWKGRPGPDGTAEIGYGLAARYRGRGYATEALEALVSWMVARPDCARLTAEVLEAQPAVAAAAEADRLHPRPVRPAVRLVRVLPVVIAGRPFP